MDPQIFEDDDLRWLYTKSFEHYRDFGTAITEEALQVMVEDALEQDPKSVDPDAIQDIWDEASEPDGAARPFMFRHTHEFIAKNKVSDALSRAFDTLDKGRLTDAVAKLEADLSDIAATQDEEEVIDAFDDVDGLFAALDEEYTDPETGEVHGLKLGIFTVDQQMKGGLRKGQLGIFMAPPGQGKSHALVFAARKAVADGYNVVHFTLEMSRLQIYERFWSKIVDMDSAEIPNNLADFKREVEQESKRMVKKGAGAYVVKYYPTKSASVRMLKEYLKKVERKYGRIDLVVVDYADILQANHRTERRVDEQASIYEDLRGLAGELQVPVWTASQANRKAFGRKKVDMTYIADSWDKVKVADYIIAITRPKDASDERVFWQFIKSRNTQPEGIVKIHQDLSRSMFEDLGYDDGSEDEKPDPSGG